MNIHREIAKAQAALLYLQDVGVACEEHPRETRLSTDRTQSCLHALVFCCRHVRKGGVAECAITAGPSRNQFHTFGSCEPVQCLCVNSVVNVRWNMERASTHFVVDT